MDIAAPARQAVRCVNDPYRNRSAARRVFMPLRVIDPLDQPQRRQRQPRAGDREHAADRQPIARRGSAPRSSRPRPRRRASTTKLPMNPPTPASAGGAADRQREVDELGTAARAADDQPRSDGDERMAPTRPARPACPARSRRSPPPAARSASEQPLRRWASRCGADEVARRPRPARCVTISATSAPSRIDAGLRPIARRRSRPQPPSGSVAGSAAPRPAPPSTRPCVLVGQPHRAGGEIDAGASARRCGRSRPLRSASRSSHGRATRARRAPAPIRARAHRDDGQSPLALRHRADRIDRAPPDRRGRAWPAIMSSFAHAAARSYSLNPHRPNSCWDGWSVRPKW